MMFIFYEADLPTPTYTGHRDETIQTIISGILLIASLVFLVFVVIQTLKSLKARS